jgi:AAA+ ATPase superfamily predicted ATPase
VFIGREKEINLLRERKRADRAQLIVLYGRRRVGKTALIEKGYENEVIWKFEGLEGESTINQIRHFILLLSKYSKDQSLKNRKISTWADAFTALDEKIGDKEINIFLDEFQWLASMRKQAVSIFKWAYDNYFNKRKGCRFIICGSISSFIVRKVIKSTALYGRIDLEICLRPFSIRETYLFFNKKRTRTETLDIYMALGGIPQYLLELDPKKSMVQNLNDLAFSMSGYLFNEYQRLFASHFSHNGNYETILRILSQRGTLTSDELAHSLGMATGGTLTHLIEDLELAGFIERYSPIDKQSNSRLVRMRITDEYINFYFKFIDRNRRAIEEGTLKGFEVLTGPVFEQWRGYAFEKVCNKHALAISSALGFSGIRYQSGSWFRNRNGSKTQIDLMFKRADNVLTVCEVKYVNSFNAPTMLRSFDDNLKVLTEYFSLPIQKVLISGLKISIPDRIKSYFDSILFAEDIFIS